MSVSKAMNKESQQFRFIREHLGYSQDQFAQYLGVTRSWVLTRETERVRIKPADWSLILKKWPDVEALVPSDITNAIKVNITPSGRIPVVGSIPAGWSRVVSNDNDIDYVPRFNERGDRLFACIVSGDSMQPALREGDVVVFQDLQEGDDAMLHDGRVVAVSWVSGEVCVARMTRIDERHLRLNKDNKKYQSKVIELGEEEIARIGVLVSHRKDWA